MRIRKNACKLILGSATSIYGSTIESPPNAVAFASEAEEVICELNCSPWDAILFDNPSCNKYIFSFVDDAYNFKEDIGGILGNDIKDEMEPISSMITSTVAELTLKEIKEIESEKVKKKKTKTKKSSSNKGKEILAEETTSSSSIQYCKKSDGKGWHCKRPALPHSRLCSYHLAQCRSYSSNLSHKSAADSSSVMPDNGKNDQKVRKTGDSNLYYYYGGFGPRRGKRRGSSSSTTTRAGGIDAKVEEDEAEKEGRLDGRESAAHECINDENVAGDDLDCIDDDSDDSGENYCSTQRKVEGIKEEEEEEKKKKVLKKRGRKPIKARSLKSLL